MPEAVAVLMKNNITSGLMVTEMPEAQFINEFNAQLGDNGTMIAKEIYELASDSRVGNELVLVALREACPTAESCALGTSSSLDRHLGLELKAPEQSHSR